MTVPPSRVTPPAAPPPVVPLVAAELQHEWDLYHATWFTLMGVGGGIFLLARLCRVERDLGVWLGLPVVDLVSFVVIGVGGLVLVWSLGRPFRMLRAVLRPRTSWISRGAIADFVFLALGALLVLPGLTLRGATPLAGLPWDPWAATAAGRAIEAVSLAAAAVVIVYAGLVLADRAAIPFWRSPLIPAQFVLSSLAMSAATVMTLAALNGAPLDAVQPAILAASLVLLLGAIARHLATDRARPGKAESLARLRTRYRALFFGGVVGAGTALPAALALLAVAAPAARAPLGLACLVLTVAGGFFLRLVTLRVGYFPPISGPLRLRRRG